mmetsp:Transcript_22395/g.55470  ORF Transcript_22395/g.55470 Transcript_22395/m.55470 type:complete len:378 (-) Transcript_22395:968-2101(-)
MSSTCPGLPGRPHQPSTVHGVPDDCNHARIRTRPRAFQFSRRSTQQSNKRHPDLPSHPMPKFNNIERALTLERSVEPRYYFSPLSSPAKSISHLSISNSIFDQADQLRAAIHAAPDNATSPAHSALRHAFSFSPRETHQPHTTRHRHVPTTPVGSTFHGRDAVAIAVQAGIVADEPSALQLVRDLLEAGLLVPAKKESSGVARFKRSQLYVFSDEAEKGVAGVLRDEEAAPRSMFIPLRAKKTSKGVHGNLDKDFAPVELTDDRDEDEAPMSLFMKLRGKVSHKNLGHALARSAKDVHGTAKTSNASYEKQAQNTGLGGCEARLGLPRMSKKEKSDDSEKRLKDEEEAVEVNFEDAEGLAKSRLKSSVLRMALIDSL